MMKPEGRFCPLSWSDTCNTACRNSDTSPCAFPDSTDPAEVARLAGLKMEARARLAIAGQDATRELTAKRDASAGARITYYA
ncbi:hypothetical protein [Gordonibacter sp.]|uniref:hypothetical protein n=1 Tax=Gordonibacter sp. TaxID=1968902 RepID=UPI002FC97FB6